MDGTLRSLYYVDKRSTLEFSEGDHISLRVTPTTKVGRAIKSGQLIPKFIGSYQILHRVGHVAYKMALPPLYTMSFMFPS
ncbi:hypothetical protein CR513_19913, partial [Mucuna pruriens]